MTMNINAKIRETAILISKSQFDTKTLFYNQGYQSFKWNIRAHINIPHLCNHNDEAMVTLLPVVDSAMVTGGEGGPSPTRVLAATDTWMLPELEGSTTSCLVEGARTTALWVGRDGRPVKRW